MEVLVGTDLEVRILKEVKSSRYLRVEFPALCVAGMSETLCLQLMINQPAESAVSGLVDVPFAPAEDRTKLTVQLSTIWFTPISIRQDIWVPRTQNSETAQFLLSPTRAGAAV